MKDEKIKVVEPPKSPSISSNKIIKLSINDVIK